MPIINEKHWNEWVKNNDDPYGKCCVDVARRVMEILDAEPGDFDAYELVYRADEEIKTGGITGFMAGAAASMISHCHSRGEEFRKKWNKSTAIGDEGDKANAKDGAVLNPALLTIEIPDK